METQERKNQERESGFTLIELLIAIVVVGILAAVAIVGIAGLTNTGSKSACKASKDGATAASAAFYANNQDDATRKTSPWPTSVQEMTVATATGPTNTPAVFEAPTAASFAGADMTVGNWTLTMTAGGASQPVFDCPAAP